MNLIERYIHQVGRHLPRKNRSDIQAELRSLLSDALEDRAGSDPTEADVVALLQEFGPPRQVAASYYPEGQYLVGPALYPLFRLVAGIALAAVLGAQLLAWGVAYFIAGESVAPLQALTGMLSSLPSALGMILIVFVILQWFEVRPDLDEEPWDPMKLPQIEPGQDVNRGERIFGIIMGIVILVILLFFSDKIGFFPAWEGVFFANPVIGQYVVWISLSLALSIGLDIYLLWQGRWQTSTRWIKIGVNLVSILVLFLLVQGHAAWLAERGADGFFRSLTRIPEYIGGNMQILGMQAFRLAFSIALIVTIIETITLLVRLVMLSLRRDPNQGVYRMRKA
jgi:hypothetical protein